MHSRPSPALRPSLRSLALAGFLTAAVAPQTAGGAEPWLLNQEAPSTLPSWFDPSADASAQLVLAPRLLAQGASIALVELAPFGVVALSSASGVLGLLQPPVDAASWSLDEAERPLCTDANGDRWRADDAVSGQREAAWTKVDETDADAPNDPANAPTDGAPRNGGNEGSKRNEGDGGTTGSDGGTTESDGDAGTTGSDGDDGAPLAANAADDTAAETWDPVAWLALSPTVQPSAARLDAVPLSLGFAFANDPQRSLLLLNPGRRRLEVVTLPPDCPDGRIDSAAGLGVLQCQQADGKLALFARDELGRWSAEGSVASPAPLATVSRPRVSVAADGTWLFDSGSGWALVRRPTPLGDTTSWRLPAEPNALLWRALQGGAAIALVSTSDGAELRRFGEAEPETLGALRFADELYPVGTVLGLERVPGGCLRLDYADPSGAPQSRLLRRDGLRFGHGDCERALSDWHEEQTLGSLRVDCPSAARATLSRPDGGWSTSGPCPFEARVDEGEYVLVVEAPTYRADSRELAIAGGSRSELEVKLRPADWLTLAIAGGYAAAEKLSGVIGVFEARFAIYDGQYEIGPYTRYGYPDSAIGGFKIRMLFPGDDYSFGVGGGVGFGRMGESDAAYLSAWTLRYVLAGTAALSLSEAMRLELLLDVYPAEEIALDALLGLAIGF